MMQPDEGVGRWEVYAVPGGGRGIRTPNSIPTKPQAANAAQNYSIGITEEAPDDTETLSKSGTAGDVEPLPDGLLHRFAEGKLETFVNDLNLLLAVSALIITLSFAAVLQPPGGIRTDVLISGDGLVDSSGQKVGQANLLGQTKSFWLFFIANGTAMAAASSAVLLLVSCQPRKDVHAFLIIMLAKLFVWFAIQCCLISFCASVWILVGRNKYKVLPFFIAAAALHLGCIVVFIWGKMIRVTARIAKPKTRRSTQSKRSSIRARQYSKL